MKCARMRSLKTPQSKALFPQSKDRADILFCQSKENAIYMSFWISLNLYKAIHTFSNLSTVLFNLRDTKWLCVIVHFVANGNCLLKESLHSMDQKHPNTICNSWYNQTTNGSSHTANKWQFSTCENFCDWLHTQTRKSPNFIWTELPCRHFKNSGPRKVNQGWMERCARLNCEGNGFSLFGRWNGPKTVREVTHSGVSQISGDPIWR